MPHSCDTVPFDSRPETLRVLHRSQASPQPALGPQGARLRASDADPGRRHSAGAGRARRAGLRHDRQRQDRGVPAADPAPADRASRAARRARWCSRRRASWRRRSSRTCNDLAVHTPITGGRGLRRRRHGAAGARLPQRRRRDHRHAGPAARSLPQAVRASSPGSSSWCSTRPTACSTWASCPTSAASSSTCRPSGRRCSSAPRCPRPIAGLTREMLHDAGDHQPRARVGAGDRHHAGGLSGGAGPQVGAARRPAQARRHGARRWSSRAPSTAPTGCRSTSSARASRPRASTATARRRSAPRRWPASRAASTACSSPPTSRRAASTSRQLGHVVNFDVPEGAGRLHPPRRPHRRAPRPPARPSPSSRPTRSRTCAHIERAVGKALPRVTVPDFDYFAQPTERFEVPIAERLAAMHGRKPMPRGRGRAKRPAAGGHRGARPASRGSSGGASGSHHGASGAHHGASGAHGGSPGARPAAPRTGGGGMWDRGRRPRRGR